MVKTEREKEKMAVYELRKAEDSSFYIYKKGVKGFIRYRIGRMINETIRQDVWRIIDVCLCDLHREVIRFISDRGADLEGAVWLMESRGHIGGGHGDEKWKEYLMFADGRAYTFETLPDACICSEIRLAVRSVMTLFGTETPCMERVKMVVFDEAGVHIRNEWRMLRDAVIRSVRGCMLSVNKGCICHYYDSHVQLFPADVPQDQEKKYLCTEPEMVDVCYLGDIVARHWAGERGGDPKEYSTLLLDYGPRLKSYFNCYDGHAAKEGEVLTAENHFEIKC